MANVIEILLRGKDQTQGLFKSIKGLRAAVSGFAIGAGIVALTKNIAEAEKAAAQLDAAFKNTGATVGLTRQRLDTLATELQATTTVSDDLVKQGQAILLTFDRVRGQAFERATRAAVDLSARLGTDLTSAIRQVGRSLQDPVGGLQALSRAGVVFTEEQKNLVKRLVETNQAAKAQDVILSELERRFGGSGAAARDTLGGALTGLKNAFGDLFEGTKEGTSSAVNAINGISKALADPDLKEGIDFLVTGFAKLVEVSVKALGLVGRVAKEVVETGKTLAQASKITEAGPFARMALSNPFNAMVASQFALHGAAVTDLNSVASERTSGAPPIDSGGPTQVLEEFNVTLRRIVDDNGDLMRELDDQTKTAVQKAAGEYTKLKTTLDFLFDEGLIGKDEYNKRIGAALDELLPEFDLNEIKSKYETIKKGTDELTEFVKGAWQSAGASVRGVFADMFYEWKFSLSGMVDVARRAVSEILAAFVTSGLKKAGLALLGSLFGDPTASAAASSGDNAWFNSLFGGNAGGGMVTGGRPRWVGEEGKRELFVPGSSGRIYNQRQLAGMGGGIVYAPKVEVQLLPTTDAEKDKEEIYGTIGIMMSKQQEEFTRLLAKSGVEVRG